MLKFIGTQQEGDRTIRTYRNEVSGSDLQTYLLRTDAGGNTWWAFVDLYSIPFIRTLASNYVVRLYGHGLQVGDLKAYNEELRALLKSSEPDRIDRAIARTYEMDKGTFQLADPVKQCIGLCTVYLLLNDERPDAYVQGEQSLKMSLLSLDVDLQSFFLNWWIEVIERYGKDSGPLSRIASRQMVAPTL